MEWVPFLLWGSGGGMSTPGGHRNADDTSPNHWLEIMDRNNTRIPLWVGPLRLGYKPRNYHSKLGIISHSHLHIFILYFICEPEKRVWNGGNYEDWEHWMKQTLWCDVLAKAQIKETWEDQMWVAAIWSSFSWSKASASKILFIKTLLRFIWETKVLKLNLISIPTFGSRARKDWHYDP